MNKDRDTHRAFTEHLDQVRRMLLGLELAHANRDQGGYDNYLLTLNMMLGEIPRSIENPMPTKGKEWLGL